MTTHTIERSATYNHNTTARVEWLVKGPNGQVLETCKTRREAQVWVDVYTLTREQVWEKHPHLKP